MTRRQRRLGLLLVAATAAAWGLETVLTAVAAEGSTTLAVNAVRMPSAAMFCLSVALRRPGAFDAGHRALQNRRTQWWLILARSGGRRCRGWATCSWSCSRTRLRKSAIAVSYTREPFTFYFAAALVYLAVTALSMAGMQVLERRAARGVEPAG